MPGAFWKDLIFSAAVLAAVAVCAVVFGPYGPSGQPDPTIIQTVPKPDFFFLWIYAVLAYLPPSLETPFILIAPILGIAFCWLLPLLCRGGRKELASPSGRRSGAGDGRCLVRDLHAPRHLHAMEPDHGCVERRPVPTEDSYRMLSPLERQGAVVFQAKQCRNCHSLGGSGGLRGPALDDVATRLTEDQLIRQVLQGGGNMPAYGKNLSPPEVTALVRFLETMKPPGHPPAIDATQQEQKAQTTAPQQ